jgi:diacylglycerol O-acyltransferase
MTHERLSTQDTALYCAETQRAPLQIGALALFEAGPLLDSSGHIRLEELRERLEARLDAVPRFRQRLVPMPLHLARPVWVDDEQFDIAEHVRSVDLPSPGGAEELRLLVSRFLESPLDERRPLWELWFVEGLHDGQIGVILKASHVMADGMALLEFALTLLDGGPDPEPRQPSNWHAATPTSTGPLVIGALGRLGADALAIVGRTLRSLAHPDQLAADLMSVARGAGSMLAIAPPMPVTGEVGSRRDFAWLNLPLPALERVKRAHDVTLNDVVLAITAGALRHYLLGTDRSIEGVRPRVLVPVSTHSGAGDGSTNQFSFFTVALPVPVDDPVVRLRIVHTQTARAKHERQMAIAPMLFHLVDIAPVSLLRALGPPAIARQPFVNLAVTNLPGSPDPLYLAGARMTDLHAFITVTGNLGAIIGVISYADRLGVSITADIDMVPDLDALVSAIEASTEELIAAS